MGAHRGEERVGYRRASFGRVIWVEAQAGLARSLRDVVEPEGDIVIEACAWSTSGVPKTLRITNNSESSSLFEFGTHKVHHPQVEVLREVKMETTALEDVIPKSCHFDFLNLDIQGAELEALKGLGKLLDTVRWIYVEVNREELYEGIPLESELGTWLAARGFEKAVSLWTPFFWGDTLFVKVEQKSIGGWLALRIGAVRSRVWFRSYPVRKLLKTIWRAARSIREGLRAL